jgi:hypothetical protein
VGAPVRRALSIEADWERLDSRVPEERACIAAIGIRYHEIWLTEAEDAFVKRLRQKVHLSGYKMGEWLAWNWWRLRWEPLRHSSEWAMAHRMTTIGGGYVWPNITVISDGERVLNAQSTQPRPAEPLRYIAIVAAVVRADEFEAAVDVFMEQVRGQLLAEGIADSNLEQIWSEVLSERSQPDMRRNRRFEALLGFDPGEADENTIERLVRDADEFGEQSVAELAADDLGLDSRELRSLAQSAGLEANANNAVKLHTGIASGVNAGIAAWTRGAEAAQTLRLQERLEASPLSNDRLCQLIGVSNAILKEKAPQSPSPLSFLLYENENEGRIALCSKWETGRRFALARLLGDRLTALGTSRLFPATRARTYRQKIQRAFAAELLCPFTALEEFLDGDFSDENRDDAAAQFKVSERTVRTILVNHNLLDREELDDDVAME